MDKIQKIFDDFEETARQLIIQAYQDGYKKGRQDMIDIYEDTKRDN